MLQANEKQQFKILRLKFSEFLKTNSHQEGNPVFELRHGFPESDTPVIEFRNGNNSHTGSSSNLVVISFLFQLSSSFLILLKVVDMFAF